MVKGKRFETTIYLGKENGKPKYKHVYAKSESELKNKVSILKFSMNKGIDILAGNDSFKMWADQWIQVKALEVSVGRLSTYQANLKHLEVLNDISITKIKTAHIQQLIVSLCKENPRTKKPTAKKTLLGIKSTASQIFDLAIQNRVIDYNPASAVKIPKGQPQEKRRALSEEEQQWIINTQHRAQIAAMIMMYCGLRRGEMIALTWNDIKDGYIDINKTVVANGNKFVVQYGKAKTEGSIRQVPIPDILQSYLNSQRKESVFVTCAASGKMHTLTSWRRMWDSYITSLNAEYGIKGIDRKRRSKYNPHGIPITIPMITPHWLRHTYATTLYFAGVDVLTAKDLLGHSDIKTTLEFYTHLNEKHKKKNIEKLNEYLKNA